MPKTVEIRSEEETLRADLHGALPARRAAILVHGQSWDSAGWRDVATRLVDRGVPALALNLRGHGGSTGTTGEYAPPRPWSPVIDLRSAKALLRERGAREIALVGSSLGGHAVLASSLERDAECVVAISAPVWPVPDELSRKIAGRKLFVCADGDGAAQTVLQCFGAVDVPKTLLFFGGAEHSIAMFGAPYGDEMIDAVMTFVARGL